MTTEELLKERYEVIAPWPGMESNNTSVGDIITLPSENWLYCDNQYCEPDYFDAYPSNFRRLPWYHGRKIEEMPEYVKVVSKEISFIYGTIIKANRWGVYPDEGYGFGNEGDFYAGITQPIKTNTRDAGEEITINVCHLSPALESDYITFINREK